MMLWNMSTAVAICEANSILRGGQDNKYLG